jgi:formate dehydrogenase subunit beta
MKGSIIQYSDNDLNKAIMKIVAAMMEKKCIDAVLAPKRIPSGESFAYELTRTWQGTADMIAFPPIFPSNGARVLKDLTRKGPLGMKIMCIMRPCEIRASVELAKLRQVDLTNIMFLSTDCPGALPTRVYVADPVKHDASFTQAMKNFKAEGLRPACATCVHFESTASSGDLHIARMGLSGSAFIVIPCNHKGETCLNTIGIGLDDDISPWRSKVEEQRKIRKEQRETAFAAISGRTTGIDNLDAFFAECVNCHNCMKVCPICYCRLCFFDSSDTSRIEAENYMFRADAKGGITFPADKLLFHLGRMSHMSLSCVGCGACEDACAMDVPVAQIFIYMAEKTQGMFEYVAGKNIDEAIPVLTYEENELHDYEDAKGQS